jgi:dolichol kinase|eukprot:CAMPEP_0174287626 /NCGR_PEP_ID=MMETSP0809-20121228/16679_1 /TAXON_ID=73025 ORGANISM="Eutreptiella gymnastica-like, Strain CCMP1594" /NCGR_SAMPLE_ID=MMETSP0809 /ASSEMBLY_ACC=CAM_ASM_000658 /LENGTH=284 /DNA_ID=CAMNT_0015384275 /DNA_START=26 /DNA_END=880 /DNA_ORIENTATION=+
MIASAVSTAHLEVALFGAFVLGATLIVLHSKIKDPSSVGLPPLVLKEFQRKSFHMIGGCIICSTYHFGQKWGWMTSAHGGLGGPATPMNGGAFFLAICFATWMLEASRLMIPFVRDWYLSTFKGLVREKEFNRAAGVAYFLPGSLAAMLAAPSEIAILGILYLSVGDAAASIGTAAGCIPIGSSSRKGEGSIGCFLVCWFLGWYVGLPANVAAIAAGTVTFGELLAEVIGLDDNLVLPMLGVLGVRLGYQPCFLEMFTVMGMGLLVGVALGAVVASSKKERKNK